MMILCPDGVCFRSFVVEWYFMVTGQDRESWFYDSPLSDKGKGQAEGVRQFLRNDITYSTPKEARLIRLMLGDPVDDKKGNQSGSSSQLISSNLRRAISTLAIGMRDRLDRRLEGDSILILSQLQEIRSVSSPLFPLSVSAFASI